MKLNPDCIRDILISVELETSLNTHIRFTPGKMPSTLAQYSDDVILGIETLWWMNCFRHLYITHHNSITQTPFHLFLH